MPIVTCSLALVATAIAAFTDAHSGRIPNWLTYPLLAIGPLLSVLAPMPLGMAFLLSLLGVFCCALVPTLLFARSAMGGGDVKLLAALGGLLGPYAGIEVQFYSFLVVTILLLGRMAWDGKLLATLRNALCAGSHLFLPQRMHQPLEPTLLTDMRMGIPIFVATAFSVLTRGPL